MLYSGGFLAPLSWTDEHVEDDDLTVDETVRLSASIARAALKADPAEAGANADDRS